MSLQDFAILSGLGLIGYYFYSQNNAPAAPLTTGNVSGPVSDFFSAIPAFDFSSWFNGAGDNSGDNSPILSYGEGSDIISLPTSGDAVQLSGAGGVDQQAVYDAARQLLIDREGDKLIAYLDGRNILTVGIGHKVLPQDGISLGDRISQAQADAFFAADIQTALNHAYSQAADLGITNTKFIAALTSANFQLGNFASVLWGAYGALKQGNGASAISHIENSAWAQQTPLRAADLIDAIQTVYTV